MPASDDEQQIASCVWSSHEPRRLRDTLCLDIGPRVPGTPGMKTGQESLCEALRRAGADAITLEPVDLPSWREGPAELEILKPRHCHYRSIQHVNSASADIAAPLFSLRSASLEEMDRVAQQIHGSIVILPGHEISGVKYTPLPLTLQRLAERGAVGMITKSAYVEGYPAIELVEVERTAGIPAIGLAPGDGRQVEELLTSGPVFARLKTAGEVNAASCANITAELRAPGGASDDVILAGAHCDTFYLNPGALDNLTGVLTLIETVRALARLQPDFRRTLRVVLYTGEEYGMLGSRAYVAAHKAELEQYRFVLNMDTLWPATAQGIAVMWSPEMRDYIADTLAATTRAVDVRNLFCMSSDYLSFMLEGIPSARPADFFNCMPPWSHTDLDTADKIDPDWIRMNAMVYAQVLARILTDPAPLPARRLALSEVRKRLDKVDAVTEIRALGYVVP